MSKVADFHTPTCIRLPRRGWPRSNFAEIFGVSKLNAGLSCGVVFVILCLAFLVELRLVTERYRQTDTQTQGHSIYRASIALRCKKTIWILLKQETVSGSGISWAICNSSPRSRQLTTKAPHHSVFYRPYTLPAAKPTASKH